MSFTKESQHNNCFYSKHLDRYNVGQVLMSVFKYPQTVRLAVRYQVNIKHQFKSQLFLHLVNTTNRCCVCPFLLTVTNLQSSINLEFTLTALSEINQQKMIVEETSPISVGIHQYVEQNIEPFFEIIDSVFTKIMQMVDKFSIRESIYPKQHEMVTFLKQTFLQTNQHIGQLNQKLNYFVAEYRDCLSPSNMESTDE